MRKSARREGILPEEWRSQLSWSAAIRDISARYLHTIPRHRGPSAVQESAESGRPVSFPAFLPFSSYVRCSASRSSQFRGWGGPALRVSPLPAPTILSFRFRENFLARIRSATHTRTRTRWKILKNGKLSLATPGERCRAVENPASTAEANRWAVPAVYNQWRIVLVSCRGQQVWTPTAR